MKRVMDFLWRFRFSIFLPLLYWVFEKGFAHLSFTKGFFADTESPNMGLFFLGGVVFALRFGVLFVVPAHLAYKVSEELVVFALSLGRPKTPH